MEGQVTGWVWGPQPSTSSGHPGRQCLLNHQAPRLCQCPPLHPGEQWDRAAHCSPPTRAPQRSQYVPHAARVMQQHDWSDASASHEAGMESLQSTSTAGSVQLEQLTPPRIRPPSLRRAPHLTPPTSALLQLHSA